MIGGSGARPLSARFALARDGAGQDPVAEAVGVAAPACCGAEEVVGGPVRQPPRPPVHRVGEQLVAQVERDLDLPHAGLGLRVGELEAAAVQIDLCDLEVHHLPDSEAGEPERRDHRAPSEPLAVRRRLRLELGGGVQQGVELVDLEEGAFRARSFEEPRGAPADAHGVAVDQLVVDGLLEDLPEQRDQHVDRGVRQRPAPALVAPAALVGGGLHHWPTPLLRHADRLRLLSELIAEAVDQAGRDLAQPVAPEEPLQVFEAPAVVHERLLGQVQLL